MNPNRILQSDELVDRRRFGGDVLKGAAQFSALMGLLMSGCRKADHHPGSHVISPEAQSERLRRELSHPAIVNPGQWLHNADFLRAMDLTDEEVKVLISDCVEHRLRPQTGPGIRHHRSPGATAILREEVDAIHSLTKMILSVGGDSSKIQFIANPHQYCGAGMKLAKRRGKNEGESDAVARDEIQHRVAVLQKRGINASLGMNMPVEIIDGDPHYHPAILTWVDCTRGRLHDPHLLGTNPPHGYVVSSADCKEVKDSLNITIDIARSRFGHGDMLQEYTAVALVDPKDRKYSEELLRAVYSAAKARNDLLVKVAAYDVHRR